MPSVLLFSGLPLDVRETDLAELLTAEPIRLAPASIAVTALFNKTATFLGTFLVEVGSDGDAERVRRQFSGQVIDGSHTLAVHHVLPANATLPTTPRAVIPAFGTTVKGRISPAAPAPVPAQKAKWPTAKNVKDDQRAPGLRLLSRLGKGGKAGEKERQKILLDKQRKAVARANPGEALLSRLAKPAKGSPAAKKTAATVQSKKAGAKGADKVSRAKKAASKPAAMEVDKAPKPKALEAVPKAKPKTQHDLDEEMKAYERQRRFA
ncbi:hypothetical protein CcaverHIS002_0210680 [Cutaneotrichosporon cavernicola]|uniref:RRM domain-containing protein n=1 Tax=Cutaneotrichosporon cavernicola TaxID=279322 RepID=A0AA48L0C4_9TREE|nr:uncharacterized protein CcaverHIS019_0210680 [Cutaneotrichosporon cavernicola]BEI81908.1 hypothetical protein CcaverHIS002_0210680 [Cutaneotrichosporon cavernicola]BEI89706.1 hypothetical protein CcaverHIS019_0210680 [Cutaneotrichosporon cavernicola]BEI97477.1 hypothetical protein CcaverHIS631_0210660 [Cutaneotrichosporon cavernicola]BEJ05255.1 hypothetical protein CcaverHIS641_0210720 [Cutaneotrichosporon cavernicola]